MTCDDQYHCKAAHAVNILYPLLHDINSLLHLWQLDAIADHLVELHGEVVVHAREGCECHLTKIDLALDVVEIDTHLGEALGDLLGYRDHLLQVLWAWHVLIDDARIRQILVHRRPGLDIIEVIDSLRATAATLQTTVVADKVVLRLAIDTPDLMIDGRRGGEASSIVHLYQALGHHTWFDGNIVGLAGGIAVSLSQMPVQEINGLLPIQLAPVAHDDGTPTVVGTLQHKLLRQLVEINILCPVPHAIAFSQDILQTEFLNMLAHLVLVCVFRPLRGVSHHGHPGDLLVQCARILPRELLPIETVPLHLEGLLRIGRNDLLPLLCRLDIFDKVQSLQRPDRVQERSCAHLEFIRENIHILHF